MRKLIIAASSIVAGLAITLPALSCQFDTDCDPGNKCVKRSGQIYGVCYGGINPGNSRDRQPVYSPTDPSRSYGNTCQFDTDCGPGSRCAKPSGKIYGVCLKR